LVEQCFRKAKVSGSNPLIGSIYIMKRIAIITGTTQGLGKELAECLAGECQVVCVNRRKSGAKSEIICDLSDKASVERATTELLDLLSEAQQVDFFLNAASYGDDVLVSDLGAVDLGRLLYLNVFAQLSLVEVLRKAKMKLRLVAISSSMGSVELAPEPYHFAYSASKAALNLSIRLLERRDGLSYLIVDPGWMKTQMGGPGATNDPGEVAQGIIKLMDKPESWNRSDGMIEVSTGRIIPW
jgi:NAD(P)-dependent dehydrogenase (short-subunit alcohol dehydrogenase family)